MLPQNSLRLLFVGVIASLTSGCGLLSPQAEQVAKGAGKLVTYYCDNVTVPEIRAEIRAAVNRYAAPNSVAVTCASGGPVLNSEATPE